MKQNEFDPDAGWSRVEGAYINGPYVIERVADGWWLRRHEVGSGHDVDGSHDNLGTFETLRDAKVEAEEVEDERDGIETPEIDRTLARLGVSGRPQPVTPAEPQERRSPPVFETTPVEGRGTILWLTAEEVERKSETIARVIGLHDRVIGVVVERQGSTR